MRVYFLSFSLFILMLPLNFAYSQNNSNQLPGPKIEISDTTLANQYFAKAVKLAENYEYEKPNFYFEKARVIYEKIALQQHLPKLWEKYIRCFNGICDNFWNNGEYEDALIWAKKALELALNKLDENHVHICYCYNDVGIIYDCLGDYDKALKYSHHSLTLQLNLPSRNNRLLANTYNNNFLPKIPA